MSISCNVAQLFVSGNTEFYQEIFVFFDGKEALGQITYQEIFMKRHKYSFFFDKDTNIPYHSVIFPFTLTLL